MCDYKEIRRIIVFCKVLLDKVRLLFCKQRETYLNLYKILGFVPGDLSLYRLALMHKSVLAKSSDGLFLNNERLEFLGDGILDAVVADIVYRRYEGRKEGFLTNTRSKIVQRETLNQIAEQIGLDKLIRYTVKQNPHNSYLGGNAFEAFVGAIYLDKGYDTCMRFVEKVIAENLDIDRLAKKEVNFKSRLIEWSQKFRHEVQFVLVDQSQEANSPVFETDVLIEGIYAGHGKGYSKKESQQRAAKEALNRIRHDKALRVEIATQKNNRESQEVAV